VKKIEIKKEGEGGKNSPPQSPKHFPTANMKNCVFSGTLVSQGIAIGVVYGTGTSFLLCSYYYQRIGKKNRGNT